MLETNLSEQLVTCRVSSPENGRREEEEEEESRRQNEEKIAGEVSDRPTFEICRKRKRSDNENEEDDDDDDDDKHGDVRREVKDDDDGFKTPFRPENRVPEIRECPKAPRKQRPEMSDFAVRKRGSSRRRLDFLPEDIINSFFADLQRTTTTTNKNKKKKKW